LRHAMLVRWSYPYKEREYFHLQCVYLSVILLSDSLLHHTVSDTSRMGRYLKK
jgi:hypothetical protein